MLARTIRKAIRRSTRDTDWLSGLDLWVEYFAYWREVRARAKRIGDIRNTRSVVKSGGAQVPPSSPPIATPFGSMSQAQALLRAHRMQEQQAQLAYAMHQAQQASLASHANQSNAQNTLNNPYSNLGSHALNSYLNSGIFRP